MYFVVSLKLKLLFDACFDTALYLIKNICLFLPPCSVALGDPVEGPAARVRRGDGTVSLARRVTSQGLAIIQLPVDGSLSSHLAHPQPRPPHGNTNHTRGLLRPRAPAGGLEHFVLFSRIWHRSKVYEINYICCCIYIQLSPEDDGCTWKEQWKLVQIILKNIYLFLYWYVYVQVHKTRATFLMKEK